MSQFDPPEPSTSWFTEKPGTAFVAAFFVLLGAEKLTGSGGWIQLFQQIGFGQWFRYLTGGIQLTGALLLVIRRTYLLGAFLTGGTMLGAMGVHIFILHHPVNVIVPGFLLGVIAVVVYVEHEQRVEEAILLEMSRGRSDSSPRPRPNTNPGM